MLKQISKTQAPLKTTFTQKISNGTTVDSTPKHFVSGSVTVFGSILFLITCMILFKKYFTKRKGLTFQTKERLIEVISTQHLGNKDKISLVKIMGEYMVVGISNTGISLITRLGQEVNVARYLEENGYDQTTTSSITTEAIDKQPELSSVRAAIKEKLTHLKPLI